MSKANQFDIDLEFFLNKYRVRLNDGRIIGPLLKEQVKLLFEEGKIDNLSKCQMFPSGDWKHLSDFSELSSGQFTFKVNGGDIPLGVNNNIADSNDKKTIEEEKTNIFQFINISSDKKANEEDQENQKDKSDSIKKENNNLKEFSYKKIIISNEDKNIKSVTENNPSIKIDDNLNNDKNFDIEKTIVRKQFNTIDESKTVINKKNLLIPNDLPLEEKKLDQSKEKIENNIEKIENKADEKIDLNAKTQVINISEVNLIKDLDLNNSLSDNLESSLPKELPPDNPEKNNIVNLNIDNNEVVPKAKVDEKKRKKITPIVAIAFLIVVYFLTIENDDNDEAPQLMVPVLNYPVLEQQKNVEESEKFLKMGKAEYDKHKFHNIYKASEDFLQSVQKNKTESNLSLLTLNYTELLPHIITSKDVVNKVEKNKKQLYLNYKLTLIKLIQEQDTKSAFNEYITVAKAKFLSHFDKDDAALNVLERYVIAQGRPTIKYLATLLNILIKSEKMERAKKVYDKIKDISSDDYDLIVSLINYEIETNDINLAERRILSAGKTFNHPIELILLYCKILVIKQNLNKLDDLLKIIEGANSEGSYYFFSKYLEYKAISLAFKKDIKAAAEYFKKSFLISESVDLRSKLAGLKVEGGKLVEGLIIESKIFSMLKKSNDEIKNKNWEKAFSIAIDAVDLSPNNIQAKINLANIQRLRGNFNEAIETLITLQKKNPFIKQITFLLVQTYLDSYKISDALSLLSQISTDEISKTAEYSSAMGKMFYTSQDYILAMKWLQESVNLDPLRDEDYYLISKIFLELKKYSNAKIILIKAIELSPLNIDYKLLYANILYESEGVDSAIGNLSKLISDNDITKELSEKDIPRVWGAMAIYYYKSGQIKMFDVYKKKFEDSAKDNIELYKFLVESSKIENKTEDVVKYSKKIIEADPTNLESKMRLGEFYFEENQLDDALKLFIEVQEGLENYPKVLFFMSKIYLMKGNLDKAQELAQKEIASNPQLEFGYLLLGDIYYSKKMFLDSEKAYKQAQEKNQNSVPALIGLAEIKYSQNNFDMALDLYLKAVSNDPNNALIRKKLGFVYKDLGQRSLAIESLTAYLKLAPDAKDYQEIDAMIKKLK